MYYFHSVTFSSEVRENGEMREQGREMQALDGEFACQRQYDIF